MKNRFIVIIVSVCVVIAVVAIGFIVSNIASSNKNNDTTNNVANNTTDDINQDDNNAKNDDGQDVLLTSKIGMNILDRFFVPNIYSESYFNEIVKNGLSDKAKILYTYIQISKKDEYSNMLRVKEDYSGSYITQKDLESLAQKLFTNANSLKHQNIFGEGSYDAENKNYIIVPMGFAGNSLNYVVEIPYKITEYDDKVEVFFYRIYGANIVDESKQENDQIEGILYYDSNRTNIALKTKDTSIFDEDEQQAYIEEKINSKEINKELIEKVKYTLKKTSTSYLIDKVEKL